MNVTQRIFAGLLLLMLSPVLAATSLFSVVCMGRPVFYLQDRAGLRGKIFRVVKFRTMRIGDDGDAVRLTRFGHILRNFSLDELPQLWNIMKGDMNFVGPRPLLPEYLSLYSKRQARRHEVKPGITGWAQVNGRNAISWEQKLEFDVWYVENRSLALDCRIILKTIEKVFAGSGVSAEGEATVESFRGSPKE